MEKTQHDKDTPQNDKKIIQAYRINNLLAYDKIDYLNNEIKDLKKTLEQTREQLNKSNEETTYWKHKHDKKTSWF